MNKPALTERLALVCSCCFIDTFTLTPGRGTQPESGEWKICDYRNTRPSKDFLITMGCVNLAAATRKLHIPVLCVRLQRSKYCSVSVAWVTEICSADNRSWLTAHCCTIVRVRCGRDLLDALMAACRVKLEEARRRWNEKQHFHKELNNKCHALTCRPLCPPLYLFSELENVVNTRKNQITFSTNLTSGFEYQALC